MEAQDSIQKIVRPNDGSTNMLYFHIPYEDTHNFVGKCVLVADGNTDEPENIIGSFEIDINHLTISRYSGKSYIFENKLEDLTRLPLLFWFCNNPMPRCKRNEYLIIVKLLKDVPDLANKWCLEVTYTKNEKIDLEMTHEIPFWLPKRMIICLHNDQDVISLQKEKIFRIDTRKLQDKILLELWSEDKYLYLIDKNCLSIVEKKMRFLFPQISN